jgi:hypothetical protein
VAGLDNAVRQAHAEGFVAAHTAAGEDEVHGVAVADEAGQADGAAVDEGDTPAAAEDAEDRVASGHAHVAPGSQLEPASDRVALDGGDHGLGEQHAARAHRAVTLHAAHAVAGAGGDCLEVGSRAEVAASAREDGDSESLVRLEAAEGGRQGLGGLAIDGIADLGAVDSDDGDWAVGLVADGHGGFLRDFRA